MDTEAQKAARRRYNESPKGRASRARYAVTENGRAAQRKAKVAWNAKNPGYHGEYSRRRFKILADRLAEIKLAAGCADCGYRQHAAALDFDHAGSEKVANVSALLRRVPWEQVLVEVAKCEVVCANCHRIRTYNERQRP